ncbi:filamentous hemagglutinin N-terminal domain-containing protein [Lacisediminimonas sp.]|uniref:two-partner secretion domain-containing protein n=1 Tax=Lacisediminimonas sp. TaxID=3060582 RepID=UPI00271BCAD6|nr:filamentous hemagglutinin N-terminal domain-containing protein [Lacisediminimonas sp.]MDO8298752.1 filamentous hemagglutinin N-terminal domain-containing protein [Lacisediminimonas sp.]
MNHIYRSIWNAKSGNFIAVSENARSAGKKTSPASAAPANHLAFALKALAGSVLLAFGAQVYALPVGGVVAAGSATIASTTGSTTITQTSANTVINWQTFNISQGQSVQFVQPSASSVALNRVLDANPSSILGNLSANGRVFLVNPNGILFGQGASVNVGGLVASTLDITDSNLMAGKHIFSGASTASILNQGSITAADGGHVALLGANVSNTGLIQANLGTVVLAAGNAMTLDLAGDGLLNVTVNEGAVNALVSNGGMLRANGGEVVMTARAAAGLLTSAVNNTGVVEATTLSNRNGHIRLEGDQQGGTVLVSGTLDASGAGAGQTGGKIEILGQSITLAGATVDASGDAGGGTILIGGNFLGAGPQQNSQSTTLDSATLVTADATGAGNGGRIAVWSDGTTATAARLSVRGGAISGDGGFVETSAPHVVIGAGSTVDARAPNGKTGQWLLDPVNWTVATLGGDETPANVTLSLALANRLIDATNDITIANDITWTSAQRLTLDAGHDVLLNATLTGSTAGSSIVINAGNDVKLAALQAITASGNGSIVRINAVQDILLLGTVTASELNTLVDMTAGRTLNVATVTANAGGSINLRAGTDVVINNAITADTGVVTLRADNDGTGPGAAAGTVSFLGAGSVSAPTTVIRFNPATYAGTAVEIAGYTAKVVGALDAKAWVFAQGNNKVYDGLTAATLAFRGNPTSGGDVTLNGGTATFNTKDVGNGKPINYTGYTLAGADMARFALFAPVGGVVGDGTTTGNITQAPLTITANNATKVFGTVATFAATAFTSTGLVNGETVGGVTETSPGTVATAPPGPTYPITPSNATGGTFASSNYAINYVNGTLSVTPVVGGTPPGSTPPGSTPPDATPPDLPTETLPGTTSPSTTSPGDSDTGSGRSALFDTSDGGLNVPRSQLAQLTPPAPVRLAEPAPVPTPIPAPIFVPAPAAQPEVVAPLRRVPKQDRN